MAVVYNRCSRYNDVQLIPIGTKFKGVASGTGGVFIRGTSLAKACGVKGKFPCKQYLFVLGRDNSEFEDITNED
jgi:hypothetical protein